MPITFSCSIQNNPPPQNVFFEDLYQYSEFKITFELSDGIINFYSDVMITDYEDIQLFVNNFINGRPSCVSFNDGNGSLIEYTEGILSFGVCTYKEGTITTLQFQIRVNDNNKQELHNIFRQLLEFKSEFDTIEPVDSDEEDRYQN